MFDGFDLGVDAGSIDVIYSNDVVEHLHEEDMLEQTSSIRRALTSGGVYVCVTPNRLSGPHDVSKHFSDKAEGFHLREYTVTESSRACSARLAFVAYACSSAKAAITSRRRFPSMRSRGSRPASSDFRPVCASPPAALSVRSRSLPSAQA